MNLSYSIHLGSDKNKKISSIKSANNSLSKTTSYSNNGIQNTAKLSKVGNHNLRLYENNNEKIITIVGTNNIVEDTKKVYLNEFESSRIEYNNKQTRSDRLIENYFESVSKNEKRDLACEIIIELGDMNFWNNKDEEFKNKMINVYKEQVKDLEEIIPEFKIANATIHLDEKSPHMHIVGVPVKDGYKNGMKKQVGKSQIFTKDSLRNIQDKMRIKCIESFNKIYELDYSLKEKQLGRNIDFSVFEMKNYNEFQKEFQSKQEKLEIINKLLDNSSRSSKRIELEINSILFHPIDDNNFKITREQVKILFDYVKENKKLNKSLNEIRTLMPMMNNYKNIIERFYEALSIFNKAFKDIDLISASKTSTINSVSKTVEVVFEAVNSWIKLITLLTTKVLLHDDYTYKKIVEDLHKFNVLNDKEFNHIFYGNSLNYNLRNNENKVKIER